MSTFKSSVLDVSKPEFDVDAYLSCQLKEKTLDELVKEEEEMVTSVRRLDSDVHQLVYENYNKFLTATSTVRKIQDEFNLLDSEMDSLSTSMTNISGLIGQLSGVLGTQREDLANLGSSYKVVKSLQFIFDLPNVLSGYYEDRKFGDVVRVYTLAKKALTKYSDMENVSQILEKTETIIRDTEVELRRIVTGPTESVEEIANAVEQLLILEKDPKEIQRALLNAAETSLKHDLMVLQSDPVDVLDLVDRSCSSFIPNLTLLASLHERLFPTMSASLLQMLQAQLADFHSVVSRLFLSSSDPKDCSIVVRALDRYYRKMSTCRHVVPGLDCSSSSISLISEVSRHEVEISRMRIMEEMKAALQETRQCLLSGSTDLPSMTNKLEQAFVFHVKTALANLLLFTASDVTFSTLPPAVFQMEFARNVYEHLLIKSFRDLTEAAEFFGSDEGEGRCFNSLLLLVLAVTLNHLTTKSAQYLLNLCREQFSIAGVAEGEKLTSSSDVTVLLKTCSQSLLRSFAHERGMQLGETLIKGCDGVKQPSSSPTGVRAAVRRAVEEVSECERALSQLLGGDLRKEGRGTRRAPDAPRDSLWCDRIDFHQPIHFNKASIITAIVKVLLKSFTESVRLQTYGKNAVEQIQVDCYYLQRGLSPLVADEVVVNSMVDQALSSALKRCLEPVLIHPSKLAQLCEDKET